MKTKQKIIYYCEYCKKHLHKRPSMEYHEKHCTANLDRLCGLCGRTGRTKRSLSVLVRYFKRQMFAPEGTNTADIKQPKLDNIMEEVNYCPICTLAIIRGCGLTYPYDIKFDYNKEMETWWENVRQEEREHDEWDAMYG